MNRLKAIIVDDERLARLNLKNLLMPFSEIEIVGEAHSCQSAIESIQHHNPHVIFLDIQLIGETGFDILDKIHHSIQVVFVTAYDRYAIRAFEINAVDYLLKPVNPERLKNTVKRLLNPIDNTDSPQKKFEYSDAVYIKRNNKSSTFLRIDSIVHISPVGNYSKVYSKENLKYIVLKTLKQWEDALPKDKFIRIHRSTIINIDYLIRIESDASNNHKLYLDNIDQPFAISRRCMKNLKANYKI